MVEPPLSDDEIRTIAARIIEATQRPLINDGPADVIARRHELSPQDEDRVTAAIMQLRRSEQSHGRGPQSRRGQAPGNHAAGA